MHNLHRKVRKIDAWDIGLVKLSVIAFVFFLVNIWSGLNNWINSIHWGWFLGAWIILALRPWKRAWF